VLQEVLMQLVVDANVPAANNIFAGAGRILAALDAAPKGAGA